MDLPRLARSAASIGLLLLITVVISVRAPLAQSQSVAGGLWSGQAQCVVVAKAANYQDEQTHTWTLTGAAPTPPPPGTAQVYYTWPATWVVQGGGRKTIPTARDSQERWTIASEMNATLRFTEIAGQPARLRIGADGQRGAPLGSIRVTEVSGRTRDASVQPWPFPAIEDNATNTAISGTSTRTFPEGFGVGWGQPRQAITTATCTWSFTRAAISSSSRGGRQGGSVVGATAAARTIALAGFTAQGAPGSTRTIALGGFAATGAPPERVRTIALTGWTAAGVGP